VSKRYRIHPDDTWRPYELANARGHGIVAEVRDVQETYSDGHKVTWHNGAHRVKAPGARTRVFIGEMSWAEAERYASDLYWERRAS
jgi:hypothetical protein